MAVTADRVIIELESHLDQAKADVTAYEAQFGKSMGGIERSAAAMETRVRGGATKLTDDLASKYAGIGPSMSSMTAPAIAAAGAVSLLTFAVSKAIDTAKWAGQLQETAQSLGITTTALQEFDFVATQTNIPVNKMRSSLEGLNTSIGRIKTNLARGGTSKALDLIHMDPADFRRLGDLEHILPVIAQEAAKLSPSGRAALAEGLRIDPGVLNGLVAAKDRLTALVERAHKYGIVVDADVIKKSAEAAEKLKTAADVIDRNLSVAFVGLVGPIADATGELAKFIAKLGQIPTNVGDLLAQGGVRSLGANLLAGPFGPIAGAAGLANRLEGNRRRAFATGVTADYGTDPFNHGTPDPVVPGTPKHAKSAGNPELDALRERKRFADMLADIHDRELAAEGNSLRDLEEQQGIAHERVLNERKKRDQDLANQVDEFRLSKGKQGLAQSQADQISAANRVADLAEDAAQHYADWFAREKQSQEQANAAAEATYRNQTDLLSAMGELAVTAAQRRDSELRLLALQEQEERTGLERLIAAKAVTEAEKAEQALAQGRLKALPDIYGARRQGVINSTRNPIEQYQADNDPALAAEKLQRLGVKAFDSLADGLAAAAAGAENLGDVAKNVFRSLVQDLLSMAIKNATSSIFGDIFGGIFGHAAGGSVVAGVPYMVGERRPELFVPSQSGRIVSNPRLASSGGGGDIHLTVNVAAENALVSEQITAMVHQGVAAGMQQAVGAAVQISMKTVPAAMARRARNTFG